MKKYQQGHIEMDFEPLNRGRSSEILNPLYTVESNPQTYACVIVLPPEKSLGPPCEGLFFYGDSMKTYWTYKPYSLKRALMAYCLGIFEFRHSLTTRFWDSRLTQAYDSGREMAHRITLRRFEPDYL